MDDQIQVIKNFHSINFYVSTGLHYIATKELFRCKIL